MSLSEFPSLEINQVSPNHQEKNVDQVEKQCVLTYQRLIQRSQYHLHKPINKQNI